MALHHKWDVKTDFAYVLQFFSLISDILGSVYRDIGSLEQLCLSIAFENQMRVCKITMIRTLAGSQ